MEYKQTTQQDEREREREREREPIVYKLLSEKAPRKLRTNKEKTTC
jgi:hypothetical protein